MPIEWFKAKDRMPQKSGYYLACVLPSNWREIGQHEALGYLKSRHGRREVWFNNGIFWGTDHPSKQPVNLNSVIVYWSAMPDAPAEPVAEPLSERVGFWSDEMRQEYEKVSWMTSVARRYVPPGVLPRDPTLADLAKVLFEALGIPSPHEESE